jgi:O-antigen/teichoic acid export membrane protein
LIKLIFDKTNIASWLALFVNLGSALFVIPFAYIYLDESSLALWFSLSLLVTLSYFSDFGSAFSLIRLNQYARAGWKNLPKYGAKLINKKKVLSNKLETNVNQLALMRFIKSNIFFMLAGALMCILISDARITEQLNREVFLTVCFIYLMNIPIQNGVIFFTSIIQSKESVYVAKLIEASAGSIRILLQLVFLYIYEDIILLATAHFLGSLFGLFLSFIILKLKFKEKLNWSLKNMSSENINSFESYQYRQGVMVSSSFLIVNSGAFIISLSPNPILVSSFFITLKVVTVLKNFCQVPVMSKIPTIAKLRATNQIKNMINVFKLSYRSSMLLFIFLSSAMISVLFLLINELDFENPFLSIELIILMSLIFFLELNHGNHAQLYLTNNHHPFLLPSVISGILILILSYFLINEFGILGLLISQGFVQLGFNNWYPIYLNIKDLKTVKIF